MRQSILKFILAGSSFLFATFLMMGCGNVLTPTRIPLGESTPYNYNPGAVSCESSKGITPLWSTDWGTPGSGIFSACMRSDTNSYVVTLYSDATSGNQWCITPAFVNGNQRTYINMQGGINPVQVCGPVSAQSAMITVLRTAIAPATGFNGIYVYDSVGKVQMANCLAQRNAQLCPKYSFGQVFVQ